MRRSAAILLMLSVAGCGAGRPVGVVGAPASSGSLTPSATPEVVAEVPWATRPAGEVVGEPRPAPAPGTPACTPADVRGSLTAAPSESGYTMSIRLEHVGTRRCTVPNWSEAEIVDADGRALEHGAAGRPSIGLLPEPPMEPGRVAVTTYFWSGWCGKPVASPWHVRLHIGGGDVDLPEQTAAAPTCPTAPDVAANGSGTFTVVDSAGQPVGAAFAAVRVSLDASATARIGEVLRYRVTLQNPSGASIPLAPCLSFVVSLAHRGQPPSAGGTMSTHRLNCEDAPSAIPAGAAVVFKMEVTIPGRIEGVEVQPGRYSLDWNFYDGMNVWGFGPNSASRTIQITPAQPK